MVSSARGASVFPAGQPSFASTLPPACIPAQAIHTFSVAESSEDVITELVRLQSFDGGFRVTKALIRILGETAVDEAQKIGIDQTVWATVLAVAYLQKHLVDQPDLLDGLVEKAKEYVEEAEVDFAETLSQAGLFVM